MLLLAPEVLLRNGYGLECDMWGIGVIAYILYVLLCSLPAIPVTHWLFDLRLCGYPPFYSEDDFELFEQVKNGRYTFEPQYWSRISESAKDLIRQLLVVNPPQRLTASKCLEHP